MSAKTRLLLVHKYFYPAIRAGGPVLSCRAIVEALGDELDLLVYTGDVDGDGERLNVELDKWTVFKKASVLYSNRLTGFSSMISDIRPDVIYLNGIYTVQFFLVPILTLFLRNWRGQLVICPRGMLMTAARKQKYWRKFLFLLFCAPFLRKQLVWHVTSEAERDDFPGWLLSECHTFVIAANIQRVTQVARQKKEVGVPLILTTVALISPMKGIDAVLRALRHSRSEIEYRLYGPVTDSDYWAHCQTLAELLSENIRFVYGGPIDSDEVVEKLLEADIYVQLSKSENFGYSIVEALQVGLPVVTSHGTPWNGLEQSDCGVNVDPGEEEKISSWLDDFAELPLSRRAEMEKRGQAYIASALSLEETVEKYRAMFVV